MRVCIMCLAFGLCRRCVLARVPRPLPVPDTRWHSVSIDWVSGLPPPTRGHDAIMTVVDRFSKRGMFIPCRKDMTADDLIYVFLREVIRLKGCPRQIVSDRDKLFESQAWKELAQRFKIEMHQTRPTALEAMAWRSAAISPSSSACVHTASSATMSGMSTSCSPKSSSTT